MYKIYIKENIKTKELLDYALKDYLNMTDYIIVYNEFGKPSLKNNECYFNVSHSGPLSVCVVSDRQIGVDIEKIKYREKVVDKAFNEEERKILNESENKDTIFTTMWTIKESYVKMLGIGLSYGLKNVDSLSLRKRCHITNYQDYIISVIESRK